jgi:hypothetical protein
MLGVHGYCQFHNAEQSLPLEMLTLNHQLNHLSKFKKVLMLARFQRVVDEKIAQSLQYHKLPNSQTETISVITPNDATTKEPLQSVQNLNIALMLNHHELREHLITGSHLVMSVQADMKTAFAVDKADHPVIRKIHS